ncbi:hypothetical protein CIG19_06940 [Enterobacterales bacterium CwR94]|nr:hypothetical protein CIG19_06940 [Enterobacterales bacterium CwR94]
MLQILGIVLNVARLFLAIYRTADDRFFRAGAPWMPIFMLVLSAKCRKVPNFGLVSAIETGKLISLENFLV